MKKRNLLKVLAISLALPLVFTACSDDDDDPVAALTKTQKLAKSWMITGAVLVQGNVDVFSQIPACDKDDIITFTTTGTGTDDEGASKCDPNDPQTESFVWVWENNEADLKITYTDGETVNIKSVNFSGSTMSGTIDWYVDSVTTVPATMTLTRQ